MSGRVLPRDDQRNFDGQPGSESWGADLGTRAPTKHGTKLSPTRGSCPLRTAGASREAERGEQKRGVSGSTRGERTRNGLGIDAVTHHQRAGEESIRTARALR